MDSYKDLVRLRRSCRKFTDEEVNADDVRLILSAALMSPTSNDRRAWQFIVIDDKADIDKLSDSKETGSKFVRDAPLVIAILGNPTQDDCWIEDASIATITMQYQAEDLGLGSCWVQVKGRGLSDGTPANDVIHGILNIPTEQEVLCLLAIGHKAKKQQPQDENKLKWENVHIGKY